MNHEQKSENTLTPPPEPAAAPSPAPNSPPSDASDRRKSAGNLRAKLPFFRTMLCVLIYATLVVFAFSLILLGGLRVQAKVIGGALLACLALLAATYVLPWRNRS